MMAFKDSAQRAGINGMLMRSGWETLNLVTFSVQEDVPAEKVRAFVSNLFFVTAAPVYVSESTSGKKEWHESPAKNWGRKGQDAFEELTNANVMKARFPVKLKRSY
jgi:hypothetical protein